MASLLLLWAQGSNLPEIQVTPGTGLSFAEQYIGYPSAPQVLQIQNSGNANLEIYEVFWDLASFVIQPPDLPLVLVPGAIEELEIIFQPGYAGLIRDTLWIINNDPQHKELAISLSGTGMIAPLADVQNLQINVVGGNVQLNWDPVTTNILGDPASPDRYLVQFSQVPSGPYFWHLAVVSNPGYVHHGAAIYAPARFYRVKAVRM